MIILFLKDFTNGFGTLIIGGDGEDGSADTGGAGFFEGLGCYPQSGAGSSDIIDQADVFAGERCIRSGGEGSAQIDQAMARGHGSLGLGITDSDKIGAQGENASLVFQLPHGRTGQQFRLVVFTCPSPPPVQRDGDYHIGRSQLVIPYDGGSQ